MRHIIFIIIFTVISCTDLPRKTVSSGYESDGQRTGFGRLATHCLRDFLTGEDAGGEWSIVDKPPGSILMQTDIDSTDNPCIDFGDFGCGIYLLQYKVTEPCCIDSTTIRINKRCCEIVGSLNCN